MRFLRKHRFHVVLGAAVVMVVAALVGEMAVASNMAFKLNKGIAGSTTGGVNLIALPANTPIDNARQLCDVFGQASGGASTTSVTLFGDAGSAAFIAQLFETTVQRLGLEDRERQERPSPFRRPAKHGQLTLFDDGA